MISHICVRRRLRLRLRWSIGRLRCLSPSSLSIIFVLVVLTYTACAAPTVVRAFEPTLVWTCVCWPAHSCWIPPIRTCPPALDPARLHPPLFTPVCIRFRMLGLACICSGSVLPDTRHSDVADVAASRADAVVAGCRRALPLLLMPPQPLRIRVSSRWPLVCVCPPCACLSSVVHTCKSIISKF